jgi:glucose-6-phosphate isomerase
MINLEVNIENALSFVSSQEIESMQNQVNDLQMKLISKKGKGNDFLGWVDLPEMINDVEIKEIMAVASELRNMAKVVVVTGIGGSYLGAKAIIEALSHTFSAYLSNTPSILFAGQNISEDYHSELFDVLDNKDYAVIVISKSGTTTEPAIAFRLLKDHLIKKYGKENYSQRIVAVTDASKGALKKMAEHEGYKTFVIPDDVGGRYSVLTPVGLLPIAVAGFNIEELLSGAKAMCYHNKKDFRISVNPISKYAATRYALYKKGYQIELMVNYHPKLVFLSEWWKQLFGESEGKDHKGLFPASVLFTTDLHSLGQYIQDGKRILFETVLDVKRTYREIKIPATEDNLDGLNYLSGKTMQYVNLKAAEATMMAHVDGKVPNIHISIPQINEFNLGQLIYFYEMTCGVSGYLLDVNPFDQPGVEAYKTNMFRLLGKP